MQFKAKLTLVNVKAGKDAAEISLKLEPLYLDDPGWLVDQVGQYLVVDVDVAGAVRTPLEEAIDAVNGR